MPICKFTLIPSTAFINLSVLRDGKTFEEQNRQILDIIPILPGQKSGESNQIPPQTKPAAPKTSAPKTQPSAENDLIDFGQNDGPIGQSSPPELPADLAAAQTANNGQQQKDLENMLRSTSTSPPPDGQSPLIDFHDDLKKNLPSLNAQALKRQDTDTSSMDEFVDAQDN
jgi:hypothetical protein